jgi:heat shock protein HslJ
MTESRLRATMVLLAVCLLLVPAAAARAQDASPGPAAVAPTTAPSAGPAGSPTSSEARPEGTWMATAYDTYGEGLVEPLRDSTLTVSLLPAGRLEGQTGCGTYIGGYTADGESIRLGVISKGSDPCRGRREDEAFLLLRRWRRSPAGPRA